MTFATTASFILGLPLAAAVFLLIANKVIQRRVEPTAVEAGVTPAPLEAGPLPSWPGWLASGAMAAAFVLAVIQLFALLARPLEDRSAIVHLYEWMSVGNFSAGVDLLVDPLSAVMCLVVTGVGALIFFYSISYMEHDDRYATYFAYFALFAASMLLLVLAANLPLLYVGWEGVGLCSYLLIGFWYTRDSAANAAKKAFIVNRIGDFAFLIGIFVAWGAVGSVTFSAVNAGADGAGVATVLALLFFAGATGKSAQIPLYIWLPDAMEGPTPVSALIHAATMVTAGVYVVARMAPVFEASGILLLVGWIGALNALLAALLACTEYDIKRVLAYSTVSQIGYMFLAEGVGSFSFGIFHLVTHAFFKALMFLGAGAVMHAMADEIDMRKMGGLRAKMPLTAGTFLVGVLAISGIVPFSGFFSKDAILGAAWGSGQYALWAIGLITAALTAFYMFRLYFRVFEGAPRTAEAGHAHDAAPLMSAPLVVLAVGAFAAGIVNLPGLTTLEHFLDPVVGGVTLPEGVLLWVLAAVTLAAAVGGIVAARSLYAVGDSERRRAALRERFAGYVRASRDKFYVDELYGRTLVLPGKAVSSFFADVFDPRVLDGLVNGTARNIARGAEGGRHVQTGFVRNYAAAFLLGVVLVSAVLIAGVTLT
ncbi:NADH-quinone oxidoreductase subunit L [soil metagenome]